MSDGRESTPEEMLRKVWAFIRNPSNSNAIMAIFTGLIFVTSIVSIFQWVEMRRATNLSNRAWVGVSRPVELDSLSFTKDSKDSKATYVVTLQNFGSSVALHVSISTHIMLGTNNMFQQLYKSCEDATGWSDGIFAEAGSPIPPEHGLGDSLFPSQEEGRHFENQPIENADVGIGKGAYVVGCVIYRDQFGDQHRTRMLYGGRDIDVSKTPVLLYQYTGFNDAD